MINFSFFQIDNITHVGVSRKMNNAPSQKMDIALIRPDFSRTKHLSFPMSLLALGSYLHSTGINVGIFDFIYERIVKKLTHTDSLKRLIRNNCKIYGITVYHGQLLLALKTCSFIKKNKPGAVIIIGGPCVAGLEEKILLKFNALIDFICIGEESKPSMI